MTEDVWQALKFMVIAKVNHRKEANTLYERHESKNEEEVTTAYNKKQEQTHNLLRSLGVIVSTIVSVSEDESALILNTRIEW